MKRSSSTALAAVSLTVVALCPVAAAENARCPEYDSLSEGFQHAVDEFMEAYRAADEASQGAMLEDPGREPRHRFTPLFLSAGRACAGTPGALPFWVWVVENGSIVDPTVGDLAVERLLSDHLEDPDLARAAKAIRRTAGVRGRERALADLGVLAERAPTPVVHAAARLQRGLLLRRSKDPGELAAAREDLEAAIRLGGGSESEAAARDALAELGALAVGSSAPTLAGVTLGGEPIVQDDLRGRVVLVEFWGMWCGPCVAKLPELERLNSSLADRPFVMVGVNSDEDPEAAGRFLASREIGWRSIADASTSGPLATAWHVQSWPTSYLLDPKGRIRARDPSAEDVVRLVDELFPVRGR